jgi:cyanate permease
MLSGTVLAPWLGGWRNVFIFFGVLSGLLIIPWMFSRSHSPLEAEIKSEETSDSKSIFTGLLHVIKIPEMWYIGLAGLFISGSLYAILGYLPLHLEGLGWEETIADGAISLIYFVGLIAVLPITSWAEKSRKQKLFMVILTCIAITSFIIFSFARGSLIWIAIGLLGLVRDAYMSISTMVMLKSKKLSFNHLGSASGFRMILSCIGFLFAPMIGNKIAESSTSGPFLFWAIFACLGIIFLFLIPKVQSNSEPN